MINSALTFADSDTPYIRLTKKNRSMNVILLKRLTVVLIVGLTMSHAIAQDNSQNSNIKLEISKEVNGEKKTFKGEYENEAQMLADPYYQDFVGEEDNFIFKFNSMNEGDFELAIKKLFDKKTLGLSFNSLDTGGFHFGFDTAIYVDDRDLEALQIGIQQLQEELQNLKIDALDPSIFMFGNTMGDSADAFIQKYVRPYHAESAYNANKNRLKITTTDGSEFGKRGRVKDSEKLVLNQLNFSPNPSNGKFKVGFKVPQQGELSVKVFDLDGKEIFTRYFNQFGGYFSETIDLNEQSDGIYLFEIMLDRARLIRKIVIE